MQCTWSCKRAAFTQAILYLEENNGRSRHTQGSENKTYWLLRLLF